MPGASAKEPKYHALLIGIDAYANAPALHGCVNDIDAVQRLLLDRAQIPAEQIVRLTSPHAGVEHETSLPEEPATTDNVRRALTELGSDRVAAGDRVFIYYAGHGSRQGMPTEEEPKYHIESLLPVDYWDNGALYDLEFNQLIARILARTLSVTVILDCCHSTGATRELKKPGTTSRFVDLARVHGRGAVKVPPAVLEQMAATATRGRQRSVAGGVDQCQVVAACLNHEKADENNGADGVRHGVFSRALVGVLSTMDTRELRAVPWGRVWNKVLAAVEADNAAQHPWMSGNLARAVLAGPPVEGDVGLAVARKGRKYFVDAGSLMGVTVGARLAVYGERPLTFPPLDSEEDRNARVGVLLHVKEATRATASAQADGKPFDLPAGARARIVQMGEPERVRCAVVPEDPKVVASLAGSPLLQVTAEADALVRLERQADGDWALTDDVHGAKEGYPVLFTLKPEQLPFARVVLEHYVRYSQPLRMATLCTDLPGALAIEFLESPAPGQLEPKDAQKGELPVLPRGTDFPYVFKNGQDFCVRVSNTSTERLRVSLVNCASSGKVEFLGDQIIDAGALYVFWWKNELGKPFQASVPKGSTQGMDRVVVIGTTAFGTDLKHLRVDKGFRDLVVARRDMGREEEPADPPVERWTATATMFWTRA